MDTSCSRRELFPLGAGFAAAAMLPACEQLPNNNNDIVIETVPDGFNGDQLEFFRYATGDEPDQGFELFIRKPDGWLFPPAAEFYTLDEHTNMWRPARSGDAGRKSWLRRMMPGEQVLMIRFTQERVYE